MSADSSFVDEVLELLSQSSTVTSRRMFGGVGIFHEGLMFALIADNELFLKADDQSVHFFVEENCPAFSFNKANGKEFKMSYYRAPESFFEEPEQTELWAIRAQAAAFRAPRKNKKPKNDTH